MSKSSTTNRPGRWDNPQRSEGLDSHNRTQQYYDDKFNQITRAEDELSNSEKSYDAPYKGKNARSLRQSEQEPDMSPQVASAAALARTQQRKNRRFNIESLQQAFTTKNLRKKSSAITLTMLLFGGGGFLTVFFSPSLAVIQMKEVFTKSLNDQLHSVEERSAALMRSKLKETTNGSCGAIKIRCRFATISDRQVEKFKSSGIAIERDMSKGIGKGRGQITKMTHVESGVMITSATQLQDMMLHNLDFRASMLRGYNPFFASLSDRTALGVLSRLGATKRLVTTGNTDEERQRAVNNAVSGTDDTGGRTLTKKVDDKGNEYYVDETGERVPNADVDSAQASADRIEKYKVGGVSGVLSSAAKGVNIVGVADSACTINNSLRFVSALAKINKLRQAAKLSMAMVLTPADSIKAGDAKMENVSFVGNNLTTTRQPGKVLDESKLTQPGSASSPAIITDPEAGMNAFDSPGYKIAAYGDAPDLSLRASRFMLAGGSVALLDKVIAGIARVVNGGNPDPRAVSQKCRYIQNPVVRFAGLGVGIIAGIGSLGLTTALTIGGSVALAMALPYIEASIADIVSGNLFQNLSGIDTGDAAYVGAAGIFGSMAMNRGMKPLNKTEGMKYLAANQADYEEYAATQKYLARGNPFDITNQFSFMGSIARTLVPVMADSKSSVSMALMHIASLMPFSLNTLVKPAKALSTEYFDKCNDPAYKAVGIDAGPFCEVRYGLSDEELAMDSLANVSWMAATGNIDPDSENGDAKDNGQTWNYMKFLEQCVNRTVGWGEDQSENEGDGGNCIAPQYEALNRHFRVYRLDQTVNDSLDGELGGGINV